MSNTRRVLDSPDFHRLVTRRWTISLLLTAALFVAYYGFILLVALDKELLGRRLADGSESPEATTLGIPIAVAVIVVAWVLTAVYVAWANRGYDRAVDALKKELGS